ncbi:DNA polymerase V family protein, partial [Methanimicrococcus sp. OttesenSCG-928-J09]|nr:DNA polymerase V family protein [Methanimicrococcus sp. OttesenSCG-928-J09]
ALTAWSIYVIAANSADGSLFYFKGQIVFIAAGILLMIFAIYYAKNGDQYKDEEESEDELGIVWEEAGEEDSVESNEEDDIKSDEDGRVEIDEEFGEESDSESAGADESNISNFSNLSNKSN